MLYVMFNVGALTALHRTNRMSANPIRFLGKATIVIRADDVTRKSEGTRSLVRIARIESHFRQVRAFAGPHRIFLAVLFHPSSRSVL
jgi:hypothetical protein